MNSDDSPWLKKSAPLSLTAILAPFVDDIHIKLSLSLWSHSPGLSTPTHTPVLSFPQISSLLYQLPSDSYCVLIPVCLSVSHHHVIKSLLAASACCLLVGRPCLWSQHQILKPDVVFSHLISLTAIRSNVFVFSEISQKHIL